MSKKEILAPNAALSNDLALAQHMNDCEMDRDSEFGRASSLFNEHSSYEAFRFLQLDAFRLLRVKEF